MSEILSVPFHKITLSETLEIVKNTVETNKKLQCNEGSRVFSLRQIMQSAKTEIPYLVTKHPLGK